MTRKNAKKRTIYSNYDIPTEIYESYAKQSLIDDGNDDPSDSAIAEEIYRLEEDIHSFEREDWYIVEAELTNFFNDGSTWILFGSFERWTGISHSAFLFNDFSETMAKAGKDCEYFHFYDVNGHFYVQCSDHDGTNLFEIKRVTPKGLHYWENWECGFYTSDNRTESEIMRRIVDRYSTLPNFAHQVYGHPKIEYEKTIA